MAADGLAADVTVDGEGDGLGDRVEAEVCGELGDTVRVGLDASVAVGVGVGVSGSVGDGVGLGAGGVGVGASD